MLMHSSGGLRSELQKTPAIPEALHDNVIGSAKLRQRAWFHRGNFLLGCSQGSRLISESPRVINPFKAERPIRQLHRLAFTSHFDISALQCDAGRHSADAINLPGFQHGAEIIFHLLDHRWMLFQPREQLTATDGCLRMPQFPLRKHAVNKRFQSSIFEIGNRLP